MECRPVRKGMPRIVLAGLAYMVIAYIIHTIGAMATMGFYTDPQYLSVWSRILMPTLGPPPVEFMYYSLLFSFIGGVLFALVYAFLGCCIKGNPYEKGIKYGFLVFLLAGIPGTLSLVLLINLPPALVAAWAMEGLSIYLFAGALMARILR